ncbi:MAG: cysteine synthase A [Candidatus Omnitrophica bacterium]|nr:cysteine synthase A [Candidatus Omnitrophota bacterium]
MPYTDSIADNITELIGHTPLVRLNRLKLAEGAQVLAKLEYFNPGGSVKDRICLAMIEDAEQNGLLQPGSTIVEPTSGNTGIGLAMIAAVKGYRCILVMSEAMSLERIYILKFYGAQIVLTPRSLGMQGAIDKAEEILRQTPRSFMPQQFKNRANPEAHRTSTALEILNATGGVIDAFVAGVGTGGTITGVGEVLKQRDRHIKVIAVEPSASAVLSGGKPGTHRIQGIGAGFVPEILNRAIIDEIITVDDEAAFSTAKALAQQEGIFVGISAGAATWAALQVAGRLGKEQKVVVMLPDTGERYFSTQQYFEA